MGSRFKIGERTIGVYDKKTKTLRKRVFWSKHLFKIGREWGIDYAMLAQLPEDATIVLEEMENRRWYWLTKKEIEEKGREFIGYSGYGLQRLVKVEDWHTLTSEQDEENEYRKSQGLELKYLP